MRPVVEAWHDARVAAILSGRSIPAIPKGMDPDFFRVIKGCDWCGYKCAPAPLPQHICAPLTHSTTRTQFGWMHLM